MKDRLEDLMLIKVPDGQRIGDAFCHITRYRDPDATELQKLAALKAIFEIGRVREEAYPEIQDEIDRFFEREIKMGDIAKLILLSQSEEDLE